MFAIPPLGDNPSHDAIRLADWVELNILMGEEQSTSVTEITGLLAETPPDNADDSERRDADSELTQSGFWQSAEEIAEYAFRELAERAESLGGLYPIEVDNDVAQLRGEESGRDVYRFLVLLRARQLYRGALMDDGGDSGLAFEKLVKHAMGAYVGSGPEQRVRFGDAGGYRGNGLPLDLREAVQELSRRMQVLPGQVSETKSGDYKGDVVAWRPFLDNNPGQLTVVAQATISEGDWMNDEPASRWTDGRLFTFVGRPITAVAFPETLSLTSRDALKGSQFSSIPFDRIRLLQVLQFQSLPSKLRKRMEDWVNVVGARLPRD